MILIEDSKAPPRTPSALEAQTVPDPPASPAGARRPPAETDPLLLLLPSSSSIRSSSPPPSYSPPLPQKTTRSAGRRFLKALVAATVLYVAAGLSFGLLWRSAAAGGRSTIALPEKDGGKGPLPGPTGGPGSTPTPPKSKVPHVPKQPSNRWDSSYYLPPLTHGHVLACAPISVLPGHRTSVTYDLPLPRPTLALRLAPVRARRRPDKGEAREPEVDVRVLPWLEDDGRWGEWTEGNVKVVVEAALAGEEGEAAVAAAPGESEGDPLQVCLMGDASQAAVGIYSSSPTPPNLVVTLLIPMSAYTDRHIASLVVDGVLGSLFVGDMLLATVPDAPRFGKQPGWVALDVSMIAGEVYIEALDVASLSVVARNETDILFGAMRISHSLEVSTGSDRHGRFVSGNIMLEPDCVCRIDSHGGEVQANVSLVAAREATFVPDRDETQKELYTWPGDTPIKPTFPSQPKLPILHPVKLDIHSAEGSVVLHVLEHLPHIPLQATLRSAGSVAAFLTPSFQGYFSLGAPRLKQVSTVLPPSGAASIADPFALGGRRLVVHRAQLGNGVVEASLGWGWGGKPDLAGHINAHSERGSVSVEMAGARP